MLFLFAELYFLVFFFLFCVYDGLSGRVFLCCRSQVYLLERTRPQACCWLRGFGGDRRPSTSSHPGIQMSPLQNSTETASPPVMKRKHTPPTHAFAYARTHRVHLMYECTQISRSQCMRGRLHGCIHVYTHTHVLHTKQLTGTYSSSQANEASWLPFPAWSTCLSPQGTYLSNANMHNVHS